MIEINLLPRRKRVATRRPDAAASRGAVAWIVMFVGWVGLGGLGFWLLGSLEEEAQAYRKEAEGFTKQAKEILAKIDEEGLQAREDTANQLEAAIEKLTAQQRTPVYLMHELSNILTTGALPEIDHERQTKLAADDPQAQLNPSWDGTSVWLHELRERDTSGLLEIKGSARDASDLSELVKRMRASVRFSSVSHPEFELENATSGKSSKKSGAAEVGQFVSFTMTSRVRFWD